MKAQEGIKAGQEGTINAFLFTPHDQSFTASIKFRIEEPREAATSGESRRSEARVPEPVPVTKEEWGDHDWNEESVAEVKEDDQGGKILVNIDNRHLVKLLRSGAYQETGIARMRNNFLLYVAFFAWAQHAFTQKREIGLQGEQLETYVQGELDRAAQTVIHSISAGGRLADEE